jgi:hypothetical protein
VNVAVLFCFSSRHPTNMDSFSSDSDVDNEEDYHVGSSRENKTSMKKKAIVMSLVDVIVKRTTRQNRSGRQGRPRGSKTIIRERRPINLIFSEYGLHNFRRFFRMNESSFWKLLDMLDPFLVKPK